MMAESEQGRVKKHKTRSSGGGGAYDKSVTSIAWAEITE